MADRMYSESTTEFFMEFRSKVADLTNSNQDARSFDPATIIAVFNVIVGLVQQLAAICNKTPPEPPPVPTDLVAEGVSSKAWRMAFQSKWGAEEAFRAGKNTYHKSVVNKMAKELSQENKTKKKLERPAAIAALDSTRESEVTVLARAARDAGH